MKGFLNCFVDFFDYIIGIIKEIWEDCGIVMLYDYYVFDIVVRFLVLVVVGNQNVIGVIMVILVEFLDCMLFGEDVIWLGILEDGMLFLYCLYFIVIYVKFGVYGVLMGKKLYYWIFVDCYVINNQINDEWLIWD